MDGKDQIVLSIHEKSEEKQSFFYVNEKLNFKNGSTHLNKKIFYLRRLEFTQFLYNKN